MNVVFFRRVIVSEFLITLALVVFILALLFWPQRDKYVRRITKSYNGHPYWRSKEKY